MVILCDMSVSDISFYIVECLFTDKTIFVMMWQYILMGIGVISILLGLYLLGKKILEIMAKGLEAAFRNKFPLDYWGNLLWVVHIFERYDFKANGLSFVKNGNVLKVTANASFDDTKTVSGINSLDLNKRQLLCLDSSERYQKVAIAGELDEAMPSAFFKIKIGASALKITKKDNKGNNIADVQFQISYHADMSQSLGTYTTGKDGTVTIDKLQPTTIYIQEIKVPDHLVLDSTVHSVELKAGQTASFTQTNNWKQGYIQVVKKDKKTVENAKFLLFFNI